jgi:hypothetical protein
VVLAEIAGTCLDTGAEIDALAKLPESEQRELAARAKAGETVSARKPGGKQSKPRKRKPHKPKSRFNAEIYADALARDFILLEMKLDDCPDEFEQTLDCLLLNADFINTLAELARHPKMVAIIAAVRTKLGAKGLLGLLTKEERDELLALAARQVTFQKKLASNKRGSKKNKKGCR